MTYAEYMKREMELLGELARARPRVAFAVEAMKAAGVMALVLAVGDAMRLPLWHDSPLQRLFFIAFWAVGMTLWRRSQLRDKTRRAAD